MGGQTSAVVGLYGQYGLAAGPGPDFGRGSAHGSRSVLNTLLGAFPRFSSTFGPVWALFGHFWGPQGVPKYEFPRQKTLETRLFPQISRFLTKPRVYVVYLLYLRVFCVKFGKKYGLGPMGAKTAKKCQFCMFSCFFNFWGSFRGNLIPLKLPHF